LVAAAVAAAAVVVVAAVAAVVDIHDCFYVCIGDDGGGIGHHALRQL
jgi:hypothetical protein